MPLRLMVWGRVLIRTTTFKGECRFQRSTTESSFPNGWLGGQSKKILPRRLASPWSRDRKIEGNKENQHVTEGDFAMAWLLDIDPFKKVTCLRKPSSSLAETQKNAGTHEGFRHLEVGNRLLPTTDEAKAGNAQESEASGRWLGNWRDIHLCII